MARFIALSVLLLTFISSASATTIFIDNLAGFNTAVSGLTAQGTEDFESSTLGPSLADQVDDSLTPGVPSTTNGGAPNYFPTGTTVGLGLTIQSNTGGGMPSSPAPFGPLGLATASAGFLGTPTDQVSTSQPFHSFDMIFGLTDTSAVSFNPLVFDFNATSGTGLFNIRVFDTSNLLIASMDDILAAAFTAPTTHIGVVAMASEDIGRINLFGTGIIAAGGNIEYTGADNISIWTKATDPGPGIPVPATLALFGMGLAGLGWSRRKNS